MRWGLCYCGTTYDANSGDRSNLEAAARFFCRFLRFAWSRAMGIYNPGKGRKRTVKKFTNRDGLWMVLLIAAAMVIMMVLWMVGVFRLDAD
jgi:hypothetical protein